MRGGTRTPSFAIVWYIEASCSTVIASPCPIGRFANDDPDHVLGSGRMPALSPGSSMPVCVPMPNFRS